MSDDSPDQAAQRAEARAEAAATRRRWLTLAEIVAIAGVVIAALSLWNNWQEREADQRARDAQLAAVAGTARDKALVMLIASPKADGSRLSLADPAHRIQSIEVRFPNALGVAPKTSTLDLSIEAGWFQNALLKATDGGPADRQGRLPVLITADYWEGGQRMTDSAIYDIIWRTHGRLLRGRVLQMQGIVLVRRQKATQAAVDTLWQRQMPRPA